MNKFVEELKTRFAQLENRERIALLSLCSFLVVVIFYFLIWVPTTEFVDSGKRDYDRHLKLLKYLRSTEAEATASKTRPNPEMSARSLLTTVTRTAQTVGVTPSKLQPEGNEAVSVWFDSVPFSRLMLFLERLKATQNIVVRQISVESQDEPGKVSARVILRT